ncbi:MAG: AAA family ATPase [Ignavibacteriaceae bacterium]
MRIDTKGKDKKKYPFNIPAIHNSVKLNLSENVTFFVGENGSGKSTLLEAVADICGFNLSGGSRNHNYDFHKTESDLSSAIKLSWFPSKVTQGFFMRAESFFNFATYIDRLIEEDSQIVNAYGGKSLHKQSHGESFLSLFQNRFEKGLYILDEPEAALSPQRQLSFLLIIHQLESSGKAQFLIASHSPILLSYPNATIYNLDNEGIQRIEYKDTEHYKLTKQFLDAPERYYRFLFNNDG